MSNVYVLEPPTKGKVRRAVDSKPMSLARTKSKLEVLAPQVVLRTTLGDLDVELWPKEAPKAVRNFVQVRRHGAGSRPPDLWEGLQLLSFGGAAVLMMSTPGGSKTLWAAPPAWPPLL